MAPNQSANDALWSSSHDPWPLSPHYPHGNRDVIGQAKGILMERYGVTADAAFGVLARVSQAEKLKLAEIACRLAETGELPGAPLRGPNSADLDRMARSS